MSVFVDTSALYAVLDADDDQHSRAIAEWHRLVRGTFSLVTTSYVLVETTALIQHRLGVDAARALDQDIRPVLRVEWIDEGPALRRDGIHSRRWPQTPEPR